MRFFLASGLAGLAVLAAVPVALAPVEAAAPAPARWTVNKPASKVGFRSSFAGGAFVGRFGRWDAAITFDPKNLAASRVAAVIDMASARTGEESRDAALPTADWFHSTKFPRATFVSRNFKSLGNNRYQATGDLTIRGVKRPVVLPFTLAITGNQAKMAGVLKLDRTHFGVGQGQWSSGETVPTAVTVEVAITATRNGAKK